MLYSESTEKIVLTEKGSPFFSVIMACRNAEQYIRESIKSVLSQTISDWELVIVDDASTDKSYDLAQTFSECDARIKLFRMETNMGAAEARNFAVANSTGKWLAILDADDFFLPSKLEKQRAYIDSYLNDRLVLLGTGVIEISSAGVFKQSYTYPLASRKLKSSLYAHSRFPPHSSIVYSASAFKLVGGFRPRFLRAEDYDLWLRLADAGDFAAIPEPLVKYRLHHSGISVTACINGFYQHAYAGAANISSRFRNEGLDDPAESDLDFKELLSFVHARYDNSNYQHTDYFVEEVKKLILARSWGHVSHLIFFHPLAFGIFLLRKVGLMSFDKSTFQNFMNIKGEAKNKGKNFTTY